MKNEFIVDQDITKASTLPSSFYKTDSIFDQIKEKIFLKSWQFIGDEELVKLPKSAHPFILLNSYLNEPMLLTKDEDGNLHCMSNVCTHRANLVVMGSGKLKKLTCISSSQISTATMGPLIICRSRSRL